MALLDINFDEVPDVVLKIAPGQYLLSIESAEVIDNPDPKKAGHRQLVVKHKVKTEGSPEFDRGITKKIDVDTQKTMLKNLYQAATGNRPGAGGFDPVDLVGRTCQAVIGSFTFVKDNKTIEMASVDEYLIPQS